MIESALYSRLVLALGSDLGTRVYPLVAPQLVTHPLAVYNTVTQQVTHDLSGPSNLLHSHVQVDVYADTYAQAKSMAKKVRQSLAGWTLPLSVYVDDAGTDMIEDSVQPNLYRVSMRFGMYNLDA